MQKEKNKNVLRRTFLKKSARSTAAIASMTSAPAVWAAGFSPNETIGVGHIGIGVRGDDLVVQIAGDAKKDRPGVPKTQIRALCDVYQGHLDKGMRLCGNPNAKTYHDYQEMLVDQDIDAVVIATPDHWHSKMVIDSANAGKDIYVEKCWTRTIPEAKAMLKAIKLNQTVMQLGHDRSSASAIQAHEIIRDGVLGEVTLVHTGCYRNRQRGRDEWRWYGEYNQFEVPNETQVRKELDWSRFLGTAPYHPFSMERFWHWRCYWDYGTGIAGDLLSHAFDFAQYVLKRGIPGSAMCSGANHVLKDGREAPDTWNVIYEYDNPGMTLTYTTTFNSELFGINIHGPEIRGKDALMKMKGDGFDIYAEDTSLKYKPGFDSGKIQSEKPFQSFDPEATPEQPSHIQDFFNCMRTRQKPKDNEDEAFIEAVTCIMSVAAYFQKRTVYWDADRQEIV